MFITRLNHVASKCTAFFNQFFSWSFWLSSTLPRLVVLRWVVLRFAVFFLLRCLVLCCDVMLCAVICFLLVTCTLVCWLKISQFSCSFVAQLDTTTRRFDQLDDFISKTSIVYSPQGKTVFSVDHDYFLCAFSCPG